MPVRFVVRAAASLFIAFCGALLAQDQAADLELQRLQAAVSVINAEIKANLDEVIALQAAIRANSRGVEEMRSGPGVVSYDDVAAAQGRAIESEAAISARLDAILKRNVALDAEKQPLLDRTRELLQVPPGLSK